MFCNSESQDFSAARTIVAKITSLRTHCRLCERISSIGPARDGRPTMAGTVRRARSDPRCRTGVGAHERRRGGEARHCHNVGRNNTLIDLEPRAFSLGEGGHFGEALALLNPTAIGVTKRSMRPAPTWRWRSSGAISRGDRFTDKPLWQE